MAKKRFKEDVGYTVRRLHTVIFLENRLALLQAKVDNQDKGMLMHMEEMIHLNEVLESLKREKKQETECF